MTREHIHFAPGIAGENPEVKSGMRFNCEVAIYVDLARALGIPYVFIMIVHVLLPLLLYQLDENAIAVVGLVCVH